MRYKKILLFAYPVIIILLLFASAFATVRADDLIQNDGEKIKVVVKEVPPFVIMEEE